MRRDGVGQKVPSVFFSIPDQFTFYRIIPDIDKVGPCRFVSVLRGATERRFKDRSVYATARIVLFGKTGVQGPFELHQILFTGGPYRIMDMVRHLACGQDVNIVFPGKGTVEGKIHQMIHKVIEEHSAIGRSLIAVMKDILCKLPALHSIGSAYAKFGSFRKKSKD